MRWKTGLGNRLLVANLPTNMLCGLVLLAGEFGVNAESWFAGMRLNVQEIHDPRGAADGAGGGAGAAESG